MLHQRPPYRSAGCGGAAANSPAWPAAQHSSSSFLFCIAALQASGIWWCSCRYSSMACSMQRETKPATRVKCGQGCPQGGCTAAHDEHGIAACCVHLNTKCSCLACPSTKPMPAVLLRIAAFKHALQRLTTMCSTLAGAACDSCSSKYKTTPAARSRRVITVASPPCAPASLAAPAAHAAQNAKRQPAARSHRCLTTMCSNLSAATCGSCRLPPRASANWRSQFSATSNRPGSRSRNTCPAASVAPPPGQRPLHVEKVKRQACWVV